MLQTAYTIDELYTQVKDFDLVLTNDQALCRALNAHGTTARLGRFAVTPRELAEQYSPIMFTEHPLDEFGLLIEISNQMKLPLRETHHYLDRIINIWGHTGKHTAIREFLPYIGGSLHSAEKVLDRINSLPSLQAAMESFRWDHQGLDTSRVAVIEPDLMTQLDRRVLPAHFTGINAMHAADWQIPAVYRFTNEKEIIDRVIAMLDNEKADDTAIIAEPGSYMATLLQARLKSNGIYVKHTETLQEEFNIRYLLGIMEAGFNINALTVRDILPLSGLPLEKDLLTYANYSIKGYLDKTDDQEFKRLIMDIESFPQKPFNRILQWLKNIRNIPIPNPFYEFLEQLDMLDKPVNQDTCRDIIYCLEEFPIEHSRHLQGVHMINPRNAAFIPQPICFHLGLDDSWFNPLEPQPWINHTQEEQRQLKRFQILIQQGQQAFHFAPRLIHNEPVAPCVYFSLLYDQPISSFDESCFRVTDLNNAAVQSTADKTSKKEQSQAKPVGPLSQSSLSSFMTCPKRYAYDHMLTMQEEDYFLRGTLLHEFAAVYAAHPETIRSDPDAAIDFITDSFMQMRTSSDRALQRTLFAVGSCNLMNFIDNLSRRPDPVLNQKRKAPENSLAAFLGLHLTAADTEYSFNLPDIGIKGYIDLIASAESIIDYKSARKARTAPEVIRSSQLQLSNQDPDYQALMYLTGMRELHPGSRISFTYYYCLAEMNRIIETKDTDGGASLTITYEPCSFDDFLIQNIDLLGGAQNREKVLKQLGESFIQDFLTASPVPADLQKDPQKLIHSDYGRHFKDAVYTTGIKQNKTADKTISSILKQITNIRTAGNRQPARYWQEDVDQFITFIQEQRERINQYRSSRFPFQPFKPESCRDCQHAAICLRENI